MLARILAIIFLCRLSGQRRRMRHRSRQSTLVRCCPQHESGNAMDRRSGSPAHYDGSLTATGRAHRQQKSLCKKICKGVTKIMSNHLSDTVIRFEEISINRVNRKADPPFLGAPEIQLGNRMGMHRCCDVACGNRQACISAGIFVE